jgi:subtilisin family serine protease
MTRTIALAAAAMSLLAAGLAFAPAASPAAATPGDPYAPQYWFDQWQVPQLWASGARGQGVTIAEIDTGVAADGPVLAGRVLRGTDFGRFGGDGRTDRDRNPYGHGTSMASIMVGRPGQFGIRGLAPAAKLLPVAVPLAGTTDAAADDRLPEAVRWAADHGAKIISMSLGGARTAGQAKLACAADEQAAVFHALRKGAVLFAAAGNGGADSPAEEPSVCLGVVSVGAVDRTGTVAEFSSRQPYLTLTAPGVDVASIGPGGSPFAGDGTSQATAIASAAAALVWSKHPRLTGAGVVARILATLDRHGAGHDAAYGYGTLDAFRAVTAAVPSRAPNPVYTLAAPFLRRAAAAGSAPAPPAPEPIRRAARPPGSYAVGTAPGPFTRRVVTGLVVAVAGLVLFVVLAGAGVLGRRRRIAAAAPVRAVDGEGAPDGGFEAPSAEWHGS